jgi:voltage-gated potassium channel
LSFWRLRAQQIIFEAETPAGKAFDVLLLMSILLSVIVVMLDSVRSIQSKHGEALYLLEWFFTILFTVEYFFRLITVGSPLKYAKSFFGLVDLLAILPTYLSIFFPGTQYLAVIRILRVLRIFRVLKFVQYLSEAQFLLQAIRTSQRKIIVFLTAVLTLIIILGSIMYLIEGEKGGFTSIPRSIYWAIVTLTTVGYGDISPKTNLGQALAAIIMILGYSLIVVPTGIVSVEAVQAYNKNFNPNACPNCSAEGHDRDAQYCKYCGTKL